MMRTMRASAKWIMGVVAFAFVGWMVFEVGMDVSGRGSTATNVVATVNGQKIDLNTFLAALRAEQERIREQQGTLPISLSEQQALEDRVLEQLVQETILQQEFRRRGISVSDQEVIEAARTSPPPEILDAPQFQTEGQFDLEKYQRFIGSGADPSFLMALEQRYRQELPRLKYFDQLTAGVFVPDSELWRRYRDERDSVTTDVLALYPQFVVPDSAVELTDEEIAQHYRAHREEFERPATAYLSFVAVSRRPNASDTAAALARAQRVRQEIVDGADFAAVARRESADSASAEAGGDLGEVGLGQFVPQFEEAVLALRPGELSEAALSPFGYHVIRLESRSDTGYHASHILIPIELAGGHLDYVESRADTLDLFAAEQDDPSALDDVADRLGLSVSQAPPVTQGRDLQLGRFIVADAGVWAFGAVPGQTSPVIETEWAYYVFRLDSLEAAGIPPLERITDRVRQAALRARKETRTAEVARTIATALDDGATLESVAESRGLSVRQVGPFTRYEPPPVFQNAFAAVGAAFALDVNEVGGPVNTPVGTFFLRPVQKILADSSAFLEQIEPQRADALRLARQQRVQLAIASLRRAADVEDLREELEQAQREAEEQGTFPTANPLGL